MVLWCIKNRAFLKNHIILGKQNQYFKAGGVVVVAQQLRALAAFSEDLGSTPSTHMVAHNYP